MPEELYACADPGELIEPGLITPTVGPTAPPLPVSPRPAARPTSTPSPSLTPRPAATPVPSTPRPSATALASATPAACATWGGEWDTNIGRWRFAQDGGRVTGTQVTDSTGRPATSQRMEGAVSGNRLTGSWFSSTGARYSLTLTLTANCRSFTGSYGDGITVNT